MPEKIGVYFDEASVSPYLKAEALVDFVKGNFAGQCPVVKSLPRLNSEAGRALIQADIDAGAIDSVCVCGPTPRVDADIFDFGDSILVDRVNLRELCVLCYKNPDGSIPAAGEPAPAQLTAMAEDYVKMGINKLLKMKQPTPQAFETVNTILVIGGGWTGLTAALNAASVGHDVVLVEKEAELGGYAAKMYKTIPLSYPYTEAQETGVEQKISAVKASAKISVLTSTTIKQITGAPGKYDVTVAGPSGDEVLQIGSVIVAAGWQPLSGEALAPLGYGTVKNVITSMEFEAMAKKGAIARPSDGKAPASVAFLLGGSRLMADSYAQADAAKAAALNPAKAEEKKEGEEPADTFVKFDTPKHLAYSSEVSTLTALKQAGYVSEKNADAVAYVFYEHMMVPGINERYYKAAQDNPNVMLTKGEIAAVKADADGGVLIEAVNTLLGESVVVKADLVVVPTPMVPVTALEPLLNLTYRQGPAFPDLGLFDGFCDSNYICFPYETRRTGIYTAGAVRQPMTLARAEEDASGAALKAVQCLTSANRGVAVHPRSGDSSYPVFNFVRCTQCKRCTEECPFGVLDDDEKGTPMPNPSRCRRCGTCMGACPERVISFENYNIDMVGTMIKQVTVPDNMRDLENGGPRVIILTCENDAYPALDMAAMRGLRWSPFVRFVPVRCLGSVNAIWIADAMSKGIDGVMLLGCKFGDDYQCHFVKGSELCSRRMINIAESLNRLGVEPERVVQEQLAIDEYDRVPALIDNFINYIFKIGPNPFKGY